MKNARTQHARFCLHSCFIVSKVEETYLKLWESAHHCSCYYRIQDYRRRWEFPHFQSEKPHFYCFLHDGKKRQIFFKTYSSILEMRSCWMKDVTWRKVGAGVVTMEKGLKVNQTPVGNYIEPTQSLELLPAVKSLCEVMSDLGECLSAKNTVWARTR